ncbi:MAG TPA: T9SS type A sorting domain-containing protein [bacterium]
MSSLFFVVGIAKADNRVAPTVATNWPRLHGAAGTKQTAVFGTRINANSYNFLGQSVIASQRAGAFFALVPSSGATSATTFSDGTTAHFDMNGGRFLTNGNSVLVGQKTISGIETRGSIFVRTAIGTAVANLQTLGSTSTLTRLNNVIELTGSAYNGKLAMVGFSAQAGNAGAGDMYYVRATIGSSVIAADRMVMIGSANEDEGYAICQVNDSIVAIGGRTKSGANNDIYVRLIKIVDGSSVAGFTLSGAAGTGNDDVIRVIRKDASGKLILIGACGTGTGRRGYIAKISATTGTLVDGYEFTTADTDVEFFDADIMANGNIVVTGRKGNDLYLTEIQDNGHAFVMDWVNTYDSGRTGDIGNFVRVQADSTILVAGVGNDASASIDAVFWLFNVPQLQTNPNPTAFNLTAPADSALLTSVTPTLNWEASTDTLLGYTVHYELTYATDASFTTPTVVSNIATNSYTFGADLPFATMYYWKVKAQDGTGYEQACTQSPNGWRFITPPAPPTAFDLTSPADSSTVNTTTPTLHWQASTDAVFGGTVHYELTYATDASFTTPTVVSNIATNAYTFGTALPLGTMYYWKVKAQVDTTYERSCNQAPGGWRFLSPPMPPDAFYIMLNSNVASTTPYYDNGNVAGFNAAACDTFDAFDVPEPPVLGNNYIQTYFYESGLSGFRKKLSADFRNYEGKSLDSASYVFTIQTKTDQSDSVTFSFDDSTHNPDVWPVIFWNGTDYQNVLGASTANKEFKYLSTGTTGAPQTRTFALLIGDKTPPVVTPLMPAADSTSEISRNSKTTLTVSVDNTCPVRRTIIAFSPLPDSTGPVANNPRENFTTLNNMPVMPATPDNPTNGIANANLTHDWVPYTDDWALFSGSPNAILNNAQLRYITEDWAGNIDTMYVNFKLVPDVFNFTGDYPAGWNLISLPLSPVASLPAEVFTTHTGNDSGIAGGFTVFGYSLGNGYTQPSSMTIAKGYFLVLYEDNTAAAGNSGLGKVKGTIADATADVDLTFDAGAPNLIGSSVRNEDLGGNHLQADDWMFSVDNFTTTYTWADVTTTADKGGDASIWIDPTSFVGFDNASGDFTTTISPTDNLEPGKGYVLVTGSAYTGTLKMRTRRDSTAVDGFRPHRLPNADGRPVTHLDDFNGDWMVPITMSLGSMHNTLSGFGCRNGATSLWDNGIDVTEPPLPPSGNFVRAVVDGQNWGSPFGRYFVTDIRAPYTPDRMSDSWDFVVNASESGTVTMTFDVEALAQYSVPAGFRATASVNGETFDLVQNHTITFDYAVDAPTVVHISAVFGALGTHGQDPALPSEYSIVSSYPNPFNPTTTIRIGLPEASTLKVVVFNTLGEQVMTLVNGRMAAGYHNVGFDAHMLSSGMYFISAKVDGKMNQIKRVVLLR